MRKFNLNYKEIPLAKRSSNRWDKGLNVLVSNTQIGLNELSEATDIQLVEDGKIQCPRDGQGYYGNSSGTRVTGIFPYYRSTTTTKVILRVEGTHLQKYNSTSGDWDNVSGATYTTHLDMEGVTAYDNLYLCNGTDNLTKYDGTSITTFTAISAPSAPTVTRTGTAGSYTFSYKITAVTAVGETNASSAGSTTLNQATLDSSNYMTISWSAVTNATGYNVWGRKDNGWYFITYVEGNSSTSYVDKGTITPQEVFTPPTTNSTGGQIGKYVSLYKDTLFILGDPNNPSRLYYSGGGDKIEDFTISNGGGFIDISKNDGQVGTGLKVFKNSLLVFKTDSIYQFGFTTEGLPQVVQVNAEIGAISPRSIITVENDIFFASRRGIFTVGNEQGFAFDVLRTNEISARVRSIFQTIETSRLANISAIYATVQNKNLAIFSYTPTGSTYNSEALVFDRERNAWFKWTNIQANCFTSFIDDDGVQHILYGDDNSGYVKEVLTGTDDFGSVIDWTVRLRSESFPESKGDGLERYKTLKNIHTVLRQPRGSITLSVVVDGETTAFTAPISTISPSINWGHYIFSRFLFGVSYGTGVSEADNNIVKRLINLGLLGRSFLVEYTNNGSASCTILQVTLEAKYKSAKYYNSTELVNA